MSVEVSVKRTTPAEPWTYEQLNLRQREIAARVKAGGPGALLLSEVSPVITRGRRTHHADLFLSASEYQVLGIELIEVDRGGFATYHGPGQWVVFVVDHLEKLTGDSRGVRKAVHHLLSLAQDVALHFGVEAQIREGAELGLWTATGKLAALGVHIEDRVLLHGLSFNVFQTPASFQGLNPCGLKAPVAYLENLISGPKEGLFEKVGEAFQNKALARFWAH